MSVPDFVLEDLERGEPPDFEELNHALTPDNVWRGAWDAIDVIYNNVARVFIALDVRLNALSWVPEEYFLDPDGVREIEDEVRQLYQWIIMVAGFNPRDRFEPGTPWVPMTRRTQAQLLHLMGTPTGRDPVILGDSGESDVGFGMARVDGELKIFINRWVARGGAPQTTGTQRRDAMTDATRLLRHLYVGRDIDAELVELPDWVGRLAFLSEVEDTIMWPIRQVNEAKAALKETGWMSKATGEAQETLVVAWVQIISQTVGNYADEQPVVAAGFHEFYREPRWVASWHWRNWLAEEMDELSMQGIAQALRLPQSDDDDEVNQAIDVINNIINDNNLDTQLVQEDGELQIVALDEEDDD